MTSTSYLSDYVYNIFVECAKLNLINTDKIDCITSKLTYNWNYIEKFLGEIDGKFICSNVANV